MRNILYFCSKFNVFMKKITPFLGLTLIITGALLLFSTRLQLLTHANWPLLTGLLLIILGIILHIRSIKHDSRY